MKRLLILLTVCGVLAACKREGLQQYTEKSRIYLSLDTGFYRPFPTASAGNLRIDYSAQNSSKKTDTLTLNFQTSGLASNVDRSFILEHSGNAQEGVDFDVLNKNIIVPARTFISRIKVVIRRSANMAKKEVSLVYQLKANDNFELGPDRDTLNFGRNLAIMKMTAIKIFAKDIVVKPDNWDSFIAKYFGVYSEVKYRFVIDVLNKTSFPSNTQDATMKSNLTKLKTALTKYNAANTQKLQDENGILISF